MVFLKSLHCRLVLCKLQILFYLVVVMSWKRLLNILKILPRYRWDIGAGSNLGQGGRGSISKKGTLFYFGKQAEKPNLRIQAFKIRIQAFKIRTQAFKIRIQAFKIRIQVFKIRIQAFKIRIQVFKIRIQVYMIEKWTVIKLSVLCTCAFGNIILKYCYKNKIRMC